MILMLLGGSGGTAAAIKFWFVGAEVKAETKGDTSAADPSVKDQLQDIEMRLMKESLARIEGKLDRALERNHR
jgi:hypothetical protein